MVKLAKAAGYKYLKFLNLLKSTDIKAPIAAYPNQGIIVNTDPLALVR